MDFFRHEALNLKGYRPLVYTAMSKHIFYYRMFISKFVIEQGGVPLNPFMVFDYFLSDTIDRNEIRTCNNNLVKRADEIWVFGKVSDGVLAEIKIAKEIDKKMRYFSIDKAQRIAEIQESDLQMEEDVRQYKP